MSEPQLDYWKDCLSEAMETQGIKLTAEQLAAVAADIRIAHECYGQAFYTPPASDQINHELRHAEARRKADSAEVQRAADAYKAEACKLARVDPHDVFVKDGEVWRYTR